MGKLPRDLDAWYAENVTQIEQYTRDGYDTEYAVATATLRWLRCADVSMSGNALLAAVGLSAEDPSHARDIVLDVCHNLVLHDASSGDFRFQHLSVREYLEKNSTLKENENQLHHFAAERCLEFLLKVPTIPEEITPAEEEFRQYATLQLVQHLTKVKERNSQLQSKIDDFLDKGLGRSSPMDKWILECRKLLKSSPNQDLSRVLEELEPHATAALFGSCIFGSTNGIDRYASDVPNIDVYSRTGKTPLCLAVENGHRHVVAYLFKRFKSRIKVNKVMVQASSQLEDLQSRRIKAYAKAIDLCSPFRNGSVWELADAQRLLQVEERPDKIIPATALQAAIAAGNFNLVKDLLLEYGANHSMCGGYFGDALQTTVLSLPPEPSDSTQYERILDLLLQEGVVVNSQGGYCGSSMLAAARFGQEKTLLRLLEEDPQASISGGECHNILHAAVMSGRKTVVDYLLRSYPNLIDLPSRYGTPLQRAAGQNSLDLVGLFLKYNADINAASELYESALVPAARLGHKQVVNLLISEGAKVDHISKHGRESLLRQAAYFGITKLAEILLTDSMDTNIRGADLAGFTPLHLAAHASHTELVHFLLAKEAGDGIMNRNSYSLSPLDDPARWGRVHAIRQLNNEFATLKGAMHHVADFGKAESVLAEIGLEAKALYALNKLEKSNGETLLHLAVWNNKPTVVRALLELDEQKKVESGLDVNARNHQGKTPLINAAEQGLAEIAKLLMDHGADPWIRSSDNYNIFHW